MLLNTLSHLSKIEQSFIIITFQNLGIIGSYIGLFLLSSVFVSIGVYASSTSKNQITSFVTGFCHSYMEIIDWEIFVIIRHGAGAIGARSL